MFFKGENSGRNVASTQIASNVPTDAGMTPTVDKTGGSPVQLSSSDSHLSQMLEKERQDAAREQAILANSIFASVGC